jgi:CO dehydrogenase maturation factor
LNRKVVSDINDIFILLDPSSKSIKHIERVKDITRSVGISYNNIYLVGNYEFDRQTENYLPQKDGEYLGKIDYDGNVKTRNLTGESLLELPKESPACLSVKKILMKAGYL